jgi:hypothetical protein
MFVACCFFQYLAVDFAGTVFCCRVFIYVFTLYAKRTREQHLVFSRRSVTTKKSSLCKSLQTCFQSRRLRDNISCKICPLEVGDLDTDFEKRGLITHLKSVQTPKSTDIIHVGTVNPKMTSLRTSDQKTHQMATSAVRNGKWAWAKILK